jgi:hypothetical protein
MLIIKHQNHLAKWPRVHFPYIVEVPHLGGLIAVVVLIAHLWCLCSKLNNIPNAFVE